MKRLLWLATMSFAVSAQAAPLEPLWTMVQKEKSAVVQTLRELVNIESGSRDTEGLEQLAALLGGRLAALGGQIEYYMPSHADSFRLVDTPDDRGKDVICDCARSGPAHISLL